MNGCFIHCLSRIDRKQRVQAILPTITRLQFLDLDLLMSKREWLAAQYLKEGIVQVPTDYGGPKLYQLMGRLNKTYMVASEVRKIEAAGSTVARKCDKITTEGKSA